MNKTLLNILGASKQFNQWIVEYQNTECKVGLITDQDLHAEFIERFLPYHKITLAPIVTDTYPTVVILSKNTAKNCGVSFPIDGFRPLELHSRVPGEISTSDSALAFPRYVRTLSRDVEFVLYSENLILAIGDLETKFFRREMIKLFRAVFEIQLLKNDWFKVQFGVLTINHEGLAFTGPNGAGKTTFIARYLQSSLNCAYGANDKCYIKNQAERITGLGTPQLIGIRPGTLGCYENISDYADHVSGEKTYFAPRKLVSYFNKPIQTHWEIKKVIVPQLDLAATHLKLSQMNPDQIQQMLEEQVFSFSDASIPNWLIDQLLPESTSIKDNLRKQTLMPLLEMPWYTLAGNPNSPQLKKIIPPFNC